jgi:hypothetical protein
MSGKAVIRRMPPLVLSLFLFSDAPAEELLDTHETVKTVLNSPAQLSKGSTRPKDQIREEGLVREAPPTPEDDAHVQAEALVLCNTWPGPEREKEVATFKRRHGLRRLECKPGADKGELGMGTKDQVSAEDWAEFVRLCDRGGGERLAPLLLKYGFTSTKCVLSDEQ